MTFYQICEQFFKSLETILHKHGNFSQHNQQKTNEIIILILKKNKRTYGASYEFEDRCNNRH